MTQRESKVARVLELYQSGCRTTSEVSALTGLSVQYCSSVTRLLESRGLVVRKGQAPRVSMGGRQPYFYEPFTVPRPATPPG